jgi:hypothetical protein
MSGVEDFTIALDSNDRGCALSMSWENTKASVQISEGK